MTSSAKRLARALLAIGLAGAFALPSAASAGPLVADAASCDSQSLSQPFLPWADPMSYTLDPGGSFEADSPAWALEGGAVVDGNEPFDVTDDSDHRSLSLPNGAAATSKSICVGIEHPDIRFFAKASNPFATLRVDVLFEDAAGNVLSAPIGAVTANLSWSPTLPMPIVANLLPLLPGSRTAVAFRFSSSGGSLRIDDVYVDPYRWG